MAGLVITLINYEVHMNDLLTHYDYKNFGETQIEEFHFSKTYAGHNHEVRLIVTGLSLAAVFFLATYNKIKVDWTNNFYNKLLRKEVISDQSTYYHFSLNIIGEDDSDWVKDKILVKKAKFFNFQFILEVLILMMFPLPGKDHIILTNQNGSNITDE
jgi:hypothetical protein